MSNKLSLQLINKIFIFEKVVFLVVRNTTFLA